MAVAPSLVLPLAATLLIAELALAETPEGQESASSSPAATPSVVQTESMESRMQALAKALNPRGFGPAFMSGAQAEFVGPAVGISSLLLGYDAVWVQIETSAGFAVGDLPHDDADSNSYSLALRLAFPIHRGIKADYALALGGGVFIVDPQEASAYTMGAVLLGTRIRVFMSPHVATVAALGGTFLIDQGESRLVVGARPMGAAGVTYFFR